MPEITSEDLMEKMEDVATEAQNCLTVAQEAVDGVQEAANAAKTAALASLSASETAKSAADTAKESLTLRDSEFAKDKEVVHLSGNETISDQKTFTSPIAAGFNGPIIKRVVDSVELGVTYPSGNDTEFVTLANAQDKDGTNFCVLASAVYWHKNVMSFFSAINKTDSGETVNAQIAMVASNAGDTNANCYCNLLPATTNKYSIGMSSNLWANIFCATGAINTSDERQKMEIAEYPDELLDAWGDVAYRQFIFKDAYQKKGDDARTHTGLITQQIEAALIAHGVDPEKYGLFCYDKWESKSEIKDQDGNIIQQAREAGESYGLRYTECLCVEAAYLRRENARRDAEIAELKERLSLLETKIGA